MRSLLFVPGDSPTKMDKALRSGADAIIVDLEDSVAPARKAEARDATRAFLGRAAEGGPAAWVRVNPLCSAEYLDDLCAIVSGRPAGILLPKTDSIDDVISASSHLLALEAQANLPREGIRLLPIVTETPQAVFSLASYARPVARLAGLTWGAEDLSAALGAISARRVDGSLTPLYAAVRGLTLAAAAQAKVPAFDTVFPDFADEDGLAAYASAARHDGFAGMFAIHPRQVPIINAAFTPSADEVGHAQRVVDLFRQHPEAGAFALDGRMVDAPHLRQAERVLAHAASATIANAASVSRMHASRPTTPGSAKQRPDWRRLPPQ